MTHELYLNGIDADTGGPIDGDLSIDTELIAKVARGQKLTEEDLKDARLRKAFDARKEEHYGVSEGIDMSDLSQTGWGLVFPASLPQKSVDGIKDALKPLLDLRKSQASLKDEKFYKEFTGAELGYQNGESKNDFLKRFGRGPGPANPAQGVPYYILIAGSPETIPFNFQYQLDVQYAVGRIYFDRLEDYAQYAQSVVAAETKKLLRPKKVSFFGVVNPDDIATSMSFTQLVQPLANLIKDESTGWEVDVVAPEETTKATLTSYLGGKDTPALLFSASHGMSFKPDDARFLRHTGSILNQDWPGMQARQPVTDKMYFSADDIASDADVFGMVAFIFACYGGGIPKSDNFYRQAFGKHKDIAPYAFVSQLPLRLLSHPRGGALGVFAHVERAWGSSIAWDGAVNDVETFHSTMAAMLNGKPAGAATEYFNQRYAEISTLLSEELNQTTPDNQDDVKIAGMWTSNNDARNYTFIGDPAVRMALGENATTLLERQNLGSIVFQLPESVAGAAAGFQPDVVAAGSAGSAAASGAAGTNFGFLDIFKKEENAISEDGASQAAGGSINESLKNFINKLGNYLGKALDDATGLEISTYVAEDIGQVKYSEGKYDGARLRAVTRVNIHGDTIVCFPEKDGDVESEISKIHLEMVKSAQENRMELIRTIVEVASSIVDLVK
jgi:hypothetical protein